MSARGPVTQNFMLTPPKGASRQMGELYAIFLFIYVFFLQLKVRPLKGLLRLIRQTTRFCTRKCVFAVRKLKFNI